MANLHVMPPGATPHDWWACSEPERPVDGGTYFDEKCPACIIKAKADIKLKGDRQCVYYTRTGQFEYYASALDILERNAAPSE
jgi:hypothetical protein